MKKFHRLTTGALAGLTMVAGLTLGSCNEKEKTEDVTYVLSSNVSVSAFNLKANADIMSNLDSVFFSIDLDRGVIYNADSLPKGTDISGLIPEITYADGVSVAEITQEGGKRDGTINYLENPTDSVDFNANVVLKLTAANGETTRSYRIKVNVHKTVPDSLVWDEFASMALPSRMPAPKAQKTLTFRDKVTTFLMEADGSYTISTTSDIFKGEWEKRGVELAFTPDVRSMAACGDNLYILSAAGDLYASADGKTWTSTGKNWKTIIGGYDDRLLGLKITDGILLHVSYPDGEESSADVRFPVEGFSNFVVAKNKWSARASGFIIGGRMTDGTLTDATWGYDGESWARIDNGKMPRLLAPTIVPYYIYRQSGVLWIQDEFDVWLGIGGQKEDGSYNRDAYVSYNNGVNWQVANTLMQLPTFIPGMASSDNIVAYAPYSANISDAWTKAADTGRKSKRAWTLDGTEITWECPYIFLFGGHNSESELCNTIWKGVLVRMTYTPII